MRLILLTSLILLSGLVEQNAQIIEISDSKTTLGFSHERLERLDKRMHKFVDDGQLSGVQMAIMRHGELVHFDS